LIESFEKRKTGLGTFKGTYPTDEGRYGKENGRQVIKRTEEAIYELTAYGCTIYIIMKL